MIEYKDKIVKVTFKFDLEYFEEWCDRKFTDKEIEKLSDYIRTMDDEIAYSIRDFINDGLDEEE